MKRLVIPLQLMLVFHLAEPTTAHRDTPEAQLCKGGTHQTSLLAGQDQKRMVWLAFVPIFAMTNSPKRGFFSKLQN